MDAQELLALVTTMGAEAAPSGSSGQAAVRAPLEALPAFLRRLRDDPRLAFDLLLTHTAVDRPDEGRFELVYMLYSTQHGHYLRVSSDVSREDPVAPTVSGIWPIAEWQEREVYDLFGIAYDGHPDLRRIFLEDDWVGHPLRKDYRDDYMLERPK